MGFFLAFVACFVGAFSFFGFKGIRKGFVEINTHSFDVDGDVIAQKIKIERDTRINILIYFLWILISLKALLMEDWSDSNTGDRYMEYLFSGIQFQVVSSFLFLLIGFINPFLILSEERNEYLKKNFSFFKYIVNNSKESFYTRVLLSVGLITFFVFKEWLPFLPYHIDFKWIQSINILLVFFLFKNLYLLKNDEANFSFQNRLRFLNGILYIKILIFLIIPFIALVMFIVSVGGGNYEDAHVGILVFIYFNIILIVLEVFKRKGIVAKEKAGIKKKKRKKKKKAKE